MLLLGVAWQINPTEFWAGTQILLWQGFDVHGLAGAEKKKFACFLRDVCQKFRQINYKYVVLP